MGNANLYGFVQDGTVSDGPRTLPSSWRTDEAEILAFDRLDDPTPYGWWPWVEESAPPFDPAKQRLESTVHLAAKAQRIVRSYSVVDLSAEEIAAADPVPTQVPMWAAQAALKQAGAYDAINKAILGMEATNPPVFFAWTMGNFASRQSTFIGTLGKQFGMSAADIDAVFRAADQIAQVAG